MGSRKEDKRQFAENERGRQWQSAENQLARDHNEYLAEKQNRYNIEQWERENEYNSPKAQMQRFMEAGLNPDLIYGQTNESGHIAGSLTAGQGYSPTDMSQFIDKSIGDRGARRRESIVSSMNQLGDAMMQIPMYREQVKQIQLENDSKRMQNNFDRWKQTEGSDPLGLQTYINGDIPFEQRKYLIGLQREISDTQSVMKDIERKTLENALKSDTFKDEVSRIASESKISKENAEYLAKSAVYRLDEAKYSSELAELEKLYQANKNEWMDWDRWIGHGVSIANATGQFIGLKNLFNFIGSFKKPNSFDKMRKIGENTYEFY